MRYLPITDEEIFSRIAFEYMEAMTKEDRPTMTNDKSTDVIRRMTPGEALDWLLEHRGCDKHRLVDTAGYEYWMDDAREIYRERGVHGCVISYKEFSGYTYQKIERVLPALPDGYEWNVVAGSPRTVIQVRDGVSSCYCATAKTKVERDIAAAVVSEYDTRPR